MNCRRSILGPLFFSLELLSTRSATKVARVSAARRDATNVGSPQSLK